MSDLSARFQELSPLQKAAYALKETQNRLQELHRKAREPIAIVGLSCRFPGRVTTLDDFWELLSNARDVITIVPKDRWDAEAHYDPDPRTPGKMVTKWGGFLDDPGGFDNQFFGMSDREATVTDPQQRMLLELTWEAFEDAGIVPSSVRGSDAGVFVGLSMNEYISRVMHFAATGSAFASIGNSSAAAANRISYVFDLHGPSVAIDAACSSALVAVHQACSALRTGDTQLAVVGAANLQINPLTTINLTKAGVCSPDGKVKAFDADANGFVRGDGAGVFILKRLSDAVSAGDRIYGCIVGDAVNHNGGSNGLSSPRRDAQEHVMQLACKKAGIDPVDVEYVEAHATGTPIGDSIELAAIQNVYGKQRSANKPIKIGAVKTNLGHVEAACGIAGLLKCLAAFKHEAIPPTLHFQQPHPESVLAKSPIEVVSKLTSWPMSHRPRIAGVSAYGFGGANAHVLVQDHVDSSISVDATSDEDVARVKHSRSEQLLVMSARTEPALRAYASQMLSYLQSTADAWSDICWTACTRREIFEYRVAIVADSVSAAEKVIQQYLKSESAAGLYSTTTKDAEATSSANTIASNREFNDLHEAARHFANGNSIEWTSFYPQRGNLASLPKYAWHHKRFWIDIDDPILKQSQANSVSPNSKLEKKQRPELNVPFVAPRNSLEKWIALQWQDTLNLEQIGMQDNFFELGGDSLQAAALLNRLQKELQQNVHVMALFEAQNIESLAKYLREQHPDAASQIESRSARSTPDSPSSEDPKADTSSIQKRARSNNLSSSPSHMRRRPSLDSLDEASIEELLRRKLQSQEKMREGNG